MRDFRATEATLREILDILAGEDEAAETTAPYNGYYHATEATLREIRNLLAGQPAEDNPAETPVRLIGRYHATEATLLEIRDILAGENVATDTPPRYGGHSHATEATLREIRDILAGEASDDDASGRYNGHSYATEATLRDVRDLFEERATEEFLVRFLNEGVVYDTQMVTFGGNATAPSTNPTKASTAQYTYTFNGWDRALTNITAPTDINATYTAVLRTYTVTWKNGSTTLETDTNVPYGTVPTYDGSTPVDADHGYPFDGWEPAVSAITGDTVYTAKFVKPVTTGTRSIINRTVTEVTNNIATSIGVYAFDNCSALTTVDFPEVTRINARAFNICSALTTVILRKNQVATLSYTNAFTGATNAIIYVPDDLVSSYKAATNWSTYASRIKGISELPTT